MRLASSKFLSHKALHKKADNIVIQSMVVGIVVNVLAYCPLFVVSWRLHRSHPTATVLVLFALNGAFGNQRPITLLLLGGHSDMMCNVLR